MKRIDDPPNFAVAVKSVPEEPVAPARGKRAKQAGLTDKPAAPNKPAATDKPAATGRFVAGPAPSFDLSSTEHPTREQIRERAYFIYLARNGAPGDAQADWLQAERDLISERAKTSIRRGLR